VQLVSRGPTPARTPAHRGSNIATCAIASCLPDLFTYRMVPFSVGDLAAPNAVTACWCRQLSALGLRRPRLLLRPDEAAGGRRAGRRHLLRVLAEPVRRRANRAGTGCA
jgi:hypothetical protein